MATKVLLTFPILYWKKTVTLIGKILGVLF